MVIITFLFPDSGTYTFIYSFVGYQSQTKTIRIKESVEQNIVLVLDTLNSESVVVYGKRIYPITQTTISKTDLKKQNLGQDLPYLLNQSPSVVVTSDAGAGIGYTGLRNTRQRCPKNQCNHQRYST